MSSTDHAEASPRPSPLSELSKNLRHANRRYSEIAIQVRDSLRLTHRARKHANTLCLRVNIQRALGLDPRQISYEPLPVLEVTPPPFELSKVVAGRERETVRLPEQRDLRHYEECYDMGSYSDGLYSSDYDDGMDLPFVIEHSPCVPSSPAPVFIRPAKLAPRLDLPEDIMRYSWGSAAGNDLGAMSAGSGTSMSSGPQTPPDEMPKLMISVKRKSYGADVDMESDCTEKRPKYERKEWVTPAARRVVQGTNCSRR